jgi:hypothetical protein
MDSTSTIGEELTCEQIYKAPHVLEIAEAPIIRALLESNHRAMDTNKAD